MEPTTPKKKSKTWVVIIGILLIAGCFGQLLKSTEENGDKPITTTQASVDQSKGKISSPLDTMSLKTQITNNIKAISGDQDLAKDVKDIDGLWISLAIIQPNKEMISKAEASADPEIKTLIQKYIQASKNFQIKQYPRLRKKYGELVGEMMWEHDVEVTVGGKGNEIITFTGGVFAANKNKQDAQEKISEALTNLKFKQTRYKWYSGDDEYTYYKMDTPKDSDF